MEQELDYLETRQHWVRHFLVDLLLLELMRLVSSQPRHQADFLVELNQLILKVTIYLERALLLVANNSSNSNQRRTYKEI